MTISHSRKKIFISTLAAIGLATLLLFTVILPAEYGYDPLGTGEKLGLTALAETRVSALEIQNQAMYEDTVTLVLYPFESVEYKYYLKEGAALIYNWQSSAELVYDMHADPDENTRLSEVSFSKGRTLNNSGIYRAAFNGIHGWWWENRGSEEVTIHLKTSGFYSYAKEMRHDLNKRYNFNAK